MSSPRQPVLEAVCWIHVRRRRLLVVRTRGRDAFYLPGGKPEAGESPRDALARELREELGMQLRLDSMREQFVVEDVAHGLPGTRARIRCFTGAATGRPRPASEIAEMAYFGPSDEQRCAPAARQAMQRLARAGVIGPVGRLGGPSGGRESDPHRD